MRPPRDGPNHLQRPQSLPQSKLYIIYLIGRTTQGVAGPDSAGSGSDARGEAAVEAQGYGIREPGRDDRPRVHVLRVEDRELRHTALDVEGATA